MNDLVNRQGLDEVVSAYQTKHPHIKVRIKALNPGQLLHDDGSPNRVGAEGVDLVFGQSGYLAFLYKHGVIRTNRHHVDTPENLSALHWLGEAVQQRLLQFTPMSERVTRQTSDPAITASWGGINLLPPGKVPQPMPRGPQGRSTAITGIMGSVTTSSKHVDLASDFLREMIAN